MTWIVMVYRAPDDGGALVLKVEVVTDEDARALARFLEDFGYDVSIQEYDEGYS